MNLLAAFLLVLVLGVVVFQAVRLGVREGIRGAADDRESLDDSSGKQSSPQRDD